MSSVSSVSAFTGFARSSARLGPLLFVAVIAGAAPTAAAAAEAGSITVGDRSWTVVPSIQCSVYPGPVVSIAGHARGDESTEITIDYDPGSGLVEAKIEGENLRFSARDDDVEVTVDGDRVRGQGRFVEGWGGDPKTAGSFEIAC